VRALVATEALTLDQAAELAEFEDDPKTYKRETNTEKANVLAELRECQVRVVGAPTLWDFPGRTRMQPVTNLTTSAGKKITRSGHARCAGHAAFLRIEQYQPAGKRITVNYVCTDPEDHGHALAEQHTGRQAGPTLTEEEAAVKADADEATRLAWAAAGDARWQWLVSMFRAKQLPDELARAALGAEEPHNPKRVVHLLSGSPVAQDADHHQVAEAYDRLVSKEPVARLHRHTVAYYVAGFESQTDRFDPTEPGAWFGQRVADWLRLLVSIGYELSDTEQLVTTTWPTKGVSQTAS
jgi:hypothetical protein